MKISSKLALATVLVALAVVAVPQSEAACGGAGVIEISTAGAITINGACPGGYCAAGSPTLTPGGRSQFFWSLGTGDPLIGPGNDNGSLDFISESAYSYGDGTYYYYTAYVFSGWSTSADVNGCWEAGTSQCTCVLITDSWAGDGWFVSLGTEAVNANFAFTDQAVNLAQMPPVQVTNSTKVGDAVEMQVQWNIAGGDQTDPACAGCGPQGFKIYSKLVDRGAAAPTDRNVDSGWTELNDTGGGAQITTPLGGTAAVTADCSGGDINGSDLYVAARMVMDSGFESRAVSGNSLIVQCGPVLAEPDGKLRPVKPGRPAGTRGAGRGR